MNLNRRDFLKATGAAAGMAAACTFLPGVAVSATGEAAPQAVTGASALLRPSFAAPALTLPGSPIPCTPAHAAAIASAWLQPAGSSSRIALDHYLEKSLEPGGSPEFLAPESNLAPGLYDLFVVADRGGKQRLERQPHAVAVFDSFPRDFSFGVISDIHFGDFRIKNVLPDFDTAKVFKQELDILNARGVQFCLCCGDLCNIPPKTKNELLEYMDALENHARFPVLSVPGNHDGYAAGAGGGKITTDTFEFWSRYFGPMESETRFGDISLIGIDTYEKPPAERNLYGGLGETMDCGAISARQLEWLDGALARARERSGDTILFCHHNPTNTIVDKNGMFSIVPFSETGRADLLNLIQKHEPGVMFCGHVHGVFEESYAKTRIVTAPTAASVPYDKSHPIGVDIVTVKGGKVADVETVEVARVS